MRLALFSCISLLMVLSISGCAVQETDSSLSLNSHSESYLPKSFTAENILKVHPGMSSAEILDLFGEPKNISSSICGGLVGESWRCTRWEYGKFPYGRASFTFSDDNGLLRLNSFNVNRD